MPIDIEYDLNICLTVTEWNSSITDLLTSFYACSELIGLQIILVDQSPETRPEEIATKFPELVLYDNNGPGDLSLALNNGLRIARGRYVATWDPSILPNPTCIEKLIRFLDQNSDIGICGPKIISKSGSTLMSCGRFPMMLPMLITCRMGNRSVNNPDDLPGEVDWLSASTMVIRREVFSDIGYFDEGFTNNLFDLDLCRRAKENGWHLYHFPDATASHRIIQKPDQEKKLNGGDVIRLFLKKYIRLKSHF